MSQGSALKFVVDIQNEEKINELTKDIKSQETAIKALNTQLKQGAISEAQFTAAAAPLGEKIRIASTEMKNLQTASGHAGRGLGQLAYAIDDIQYGFNSIVNNIPQIVMGLGGSMGIAGAVGIAAVAVNQLIKHWGELSDIAQTAWAGGSIEQLHKLREAAEEATKAFDKLTEEHTKAQIASGKEVHEGIVEGDVGKVLQGLAGGIAMDPGLRAPETERQKLARRLVEFKPGQWRPDDPIERQLTEGKIRAELDAENRKKAREMLIAIDKPGEEGRLARQAAHRFATANPGAFPPGFAARMAPDAGEAEANRVANVQANIEGNKNIRAAEKKAEEEKLHANKELTADGIRFEKQMKHEQLETEKRDLQEKIKRGEHLLTSEGKQQLQDAILGGRAPHSASMLSGKAFSDKLLIDSLNKVPERQLKTLVGMHTTLKNIDAKMRALGLQ